MKSPFRVGLNCANIYVDINGSTKVIKNFDTYNTWYQLFSVLLNFILSKTREDILNAGHAALGNKDFATALSRYVEYVKSTGGNFTRLINAVRADTPYLEAAGIDSEIIPLVLDAAAYKFGDDNMS